MRPKRGSQIWRMRSKNWPPPHSTNLLRILLYFLAWPSCLPKLRRLLLSPKKAPFVYKWGKKAARPNEKQEASKKYWVTKIVYGSTHARVCIRVQCQYKQEVDNIRWFFLPFLDLPWTTKRVGGGWGGNRRLEGEG